MEDGKESQRKGIGDWIGWGRDGGIGVGKKDGWARKERIKGRLS